MFNVVINNEQYDEYLAQKEKIKELENWNHFLSEDLKKQRDKNAAQIKECDELHIENNKIRKELKSKEPIATITINPCRDLEEAYSPDSNTIINIKNLYLTNNYFSEEDKDD
jgi:regulator of replication initiation timing